ASRNDTSVLARPAKPAPAPVPVRVPSCSSSSTHTKQKSVANSKEQYSRSGVSTVANPSAQTIQFIRIGSHREWRRATTVASGPAPSTIASSRSWAEGIMAGSLPVEAEVPADGARAEAHVHVDGGAQAQGRAQPQLHAHPVRAEAGGALGGD